MRYALPLAALLLSGCSLSPYHGIFMARVPYNDAESECTTRVVDHNYSDGEEPPEEEVDQGDWTIETDATFSDKLYFFEIIDSAKGEVLLNFQGGVYVGTKEGGIFRFKWDYFQDGEESQEHDDGYEFRMEGRSSSLNDISFDKKGKTAAVTWASSSESKVLYTESDEWDDNIGVANGQTPVESYLIDGDEAPIRNRRAQPDCDDDPCELEIEYKCDPTTAQFSATEVNLDHEDWENVEGSGQPGGWE